jgi:stage V sporulation protein G
MDTANTSSEPLREREGEQALRSTLKARAYPLKDPQGTLIAYASISINDEFVIDRIKVINGERGVFVADHSEKDKKDEYRKTAFPITAAARRKQHAVVLDAYIKAAEKDSPELAAAAKTAREALDRQSLTQRVRDAAKEGSDKAAPAKEAAAPAREEAL